MKTRLAMVAAVLVAQVLLIGAACSQETAEKKAERIAIPELKAKLDSGEKFLLIDVREDWELEQDGAIEGAIHIPVAELEGRMKDIPKDVEVVFYWQGGGRAERAENMFLKAGYKTGGFCGIRDWKAENNPVVEKVDRPAAGKIEPE